MYEFRWEWLAGEEQRRLFRGETRDEVVAKVAHALQSEMGVARPTQTILRMVAKLTRETQEEAPQRWVLRSPLARMREG